MANLVAHHTTLWQMGSLAGTYFHLTIQCNPSSHIRNTPRYGQVPIVSHFCDCCYWSAASHQQVLSQEQMEERQGDENAINRTWNAALDPKNYWLSTCYLSLSSRILSKWRKTLRCSEKNPFGCNSFETAASQNHHCLRKADPVLPVAKLIRKCQPCLPRNCNHMQPRPPKTLSRNHRDTEEKACAIEMNVRPMAHLLHRHTLVVEGHTTSQLHYVIDCDWVKQWCNNDTSNI